MGGINTGWIIASMAHIQPIWNRSIMQFIGKTMGKNILSMYAQRSIGKFLFQMSSGPVPTSCRRIAFYAFPESIFRGACVAVSTNELSRLVFVRSTCDDIRDAATTTMAITKRDFLRSRFEDMLSHVNIRSEER